MNCRRATRELDQRNLGELPAAEAAALADHLRLCETCSAVERADRWIIDELASLRGEIPYTIDVRRRVTLAIEQLAPQDRQEVSAWQLGWATAIVGAGAVALLASLWVFWPEWRAGFENLIMLVQGLAEVSTTLAALLLSLLTVPFKMFAGMRDLWIELPAAVAQVKPFAIVGVALCYLVMAGTIVGVVGRDLRHPVAAPAFED